MPKFSDLPARVAARGGIVLFFVMGLEVLIMISPFAFFFYSVFNPVFRWLGQCAATRWLTDFFLPHMLLPSTLLLQSIRVLGSVLFIAGCGVFVLCALQVYLGKLFKWGIASRGLYRYIRHPQYLALGVWGIGMSILWPRFIVLVTLSIMFILYYYLASDEESRMSRRYGDSYERYRRETGMFFPKLIESQLSSVARFLPRSVLNGVTVSALVVCIVVGSGFLARAVTLRSLPLASQGNVTLLSILPEDRGLNADVLEGIAKSQREGGHEVLADDKDYLGYVMPPDYIMQGMIADTGGESHLFHQHQTIGLITDWVLHPFEHLRRSPSAQMAQMHNVDPSVARRHHCPIGVNDTALDCDHCPYRRVILVEVDHPGSTHRSGPALLALDTTRVPTEAIDIDARTGEIVNTIKVGRATAWSDVPTPAF